MMIASTVRFPRPITAASQIAHLDVSRLNILLRLQRPYMSALGKTSQEDNTYT